MEESILFVFFAVWCGIILHKISHKAGYSGIAQVGAGVGMLLHFFNYWQIGGGDYKGYLACLVFTAFACFYLKYINALSASSLKLIFMGVAALYPIREGEGIFFGVVFLSVSFMPLMLSLLLRALIDSEPFQRRIAKKYMLCHGKIGLIGLGAYSLPWFFGSVSVFFGKEVLWLPILFSIFFLIFVAPFLNGALFWIFLFLTILRAWFDPFAFDGKTLYLTIGIVVFFSVIRYLRFLGYLVFLKKIDSSSLKEGMVLSPYPLLIKMDQKKKFIRQFFDWKEYPLREGKRIKKDDLEEAKRRVAKLPYVYVREQIDPAPFLLMGMFVFFCWRTAELFFF